MKVLLPSLIAAAAISIAFCPSLAPLAQSLLTGDGQVLVLPAFDPSAIPSWWLSGAFLAHPIGTTAVAALSFLCSLLFCASEAANARKEDGGVLGNSRVKVGKEVVRGSATWDGKHEPKCRGYVYGFARGRYLFEPSRHVFTVGQTGSGKTRFQNILTLDLLTFGEHGENVIVSDVKNELIELCGDAVAKRGYRVLLLDTQRPARGSRFNPLKLVCELASSGDIQGAEQAAEDVAAALVPEEREGQSSHWISSARGLLAASILLVALSDECPSEARHMATVCRVINEGTEAEGADPAASLKALLRSLPAEHPARAFASQFLSSGGNELRSILSTLKVHLRMFSSQSIAWLTSASDIDPARVLSEKTALFLHVMDEGSPYNALFAVLFDQLYKAMHSVADENGGKLPRSLTILGDEWGNLPTVRCLPSLLSLARSLGVTWAGSVQNISQMNKYGERDGRKKILANCSVKVALKLGEAEDRQYFTELVGKTTRHTMGTSASRGVTSSSTRSYSEHADDVIRQFEWVTRSPDKDGAIVVKQAENGVPASHAGVFRAPLVDCTKTPTKKHFDLGSPEHERGKRLACQTRLDERAASRDMTVKTWCPQWVEEPKADDGLSEDEWSAFDDRD